MTQDRVLSGAADGRLYRVVAGEAYSWTNLLIEDQLGERFIFDTVNRALAPIADDAAQSLLESRSYRPWNGPQRWSSVRELAPAQVWSTREMDLPLDPETQASDIPDR
jgi:hypothetical protein